MAVVLLAGFQHRTSPFRMVGGVGILLTLQAYADMLRVSDAMLASNLRIGTYALEVAGVHLHTRLVGIHLHEDTSLG